MVTDGIKSATEPHWEDLQSRSKVLLKYCGKSTRINWGQEANGPFAIARLSGDRAIMDGSGMASTAKEASSGILEGTPMMFKEQSVAISA